MTGSGTMEYVMRPANDPAWVVVSAGSSGSRFAISNGFLGVRDDRFSVTPARTYVAGLFDRPGADPGVPRLVHAADWLHVDIRLFGEPMVPNPGAMPVHRTTLDMKRGALFDECCYSTSSGIKVRVRTVRLVSFEQRSVGLHIIQFEIDRGTTEVTLDASLEWTTPGLVSEQIGEDFALWRTQRSGKRLAMAIASSLRIDGREQSPTEPDGLKSFWTWTARPGQLVCFGRIVAVVRGDTDAPKPGIEARETLDSARQTGWPGVVAAHETAWASRWHSSDVQVAGDPAAQHALRFAIYHLNSAANPADERVSIAARALTGDDYRGHVFWDTEIFLLPFYTLTWPDAARSLLMYRFHTLDAARAKAAGMGWRGALYAWESADTGAETTPEQVVTPDHRVVDVLCGKQEQHISADVAYAVWQYWQATGDEAFLRNAGAEILLETARFWSGRARLEADGHHHIRGVIGPDEFHEHIDDNAYTNVMARWNIRRALDVAALLRERWPACWARLSNDLGLDETELRQWQTVAETMATGLDPETGLFEQFAGYFALEDIDPANYAVRAVPIDIVLGRERTQKSRLVKQADVVALLALLPEEFTQRAGERNFACYEPRCSHDSSLSPAMHGLVAARLGDAGTALRYFQRAVTIDLADSPAAIDGGVHIAALGGIWMLAVFGFAGLSLRPDSIAIEPKLPAEWRSLAFGVQWRGRHVRITIDQDQTRLEAALEAGDPMNLFIGGQQHELRRELPLRVFYGRT